VRWYTLAAVIACVATQSPTITVVLQSVSVLSVSVFLIQNPCSASRLTDERGCPVDISVCNVPIKLHAKLSTFPRGAGAATAAGAATCLSVVADTAPAGLQTVLSPAQPGAAAEHRCCHLCGHCHHWPGTWLLPEDLPHASSPILCW